MKLNGTLVTPFDPVPRASAVVRGIFLTHFGGPLGTISVPVGSLGGSSGAALRILGPAGAAF